MPSISLRRRLKVFLRRLPVELRKSIQRRTKPVRRAGQGSTPHDWLLLPCWLFRRRSRRASPGSAFLTDALWAQYCLFLFIRIQDDLFDREADDPRLIYAADEFLLEAQRVLAHWFAGGSGFWQILRDHLLTTTRAIVEVDRLQRRSVGMSLESVEAYARVSAVLKLAAVAVCVKLARRGDIPAVSRFADALSVVDQLFDDLADLEEDFAKGRRNVALTTLARLRPGRSAVLDPLDEAARRLVFADGMRPLFHVFRQRLDQAADAAGELALPGALAYVRRQRRAIISYERALGRARAGLVLRGRARYR